ncbi:cytochrome c oxidase subunit 2 [Methylopila jiangsuensis]|uniref:Cytochrome c oxidase subunit 2 n=2 Tax=Methylopila jiangsuensis TaxID=586230 RepID=A0A9W6N3E1_9HYPH|nr:cytochrome c oxidase subunit 2 [Methylopila jiangsuensis]
MLPSGRLTSFMISAAGLFAAAPALAGDGQPSPWQLGFQQSASPIFEQIHSFHNFILVIIVAITLFVLGLLVYCVVRFNEKSNPVPSKTTHHTMLEVVWTIAPVLILVVIAIPSFRLLYAQFTPPPADLTIKVVGRQWNWDIVYPDANELTLTAVMLQDSELNGKPRLLAVDNEAVVPVGKVVHVDVTAEDVLHSFAMPAFGVKVDAVPGRLNSTWFRADREGVYYGQCSELCGQDHAFMPIAIRVVNDDLYKRWLEAAQKDTDEAKKLLEASVNGAAATNVAQR